MNLFVYGTLLNDEIVEALVGKTFQRVEASLEGYFVSRLQNKYSPGMMRKEGAIAKGAILMNIDEDSLNIIRSWEGDDYDEYNVDVDTEEGVQQCITFLWNSDALDEAWSNKDFLENHLQYYLEKDIPNFLM